MAGLELQEEHGESQKSADVVFFSKNSLIQTSNGLITLKMIDRREQYGSPERQSKTFCFFLVIHLFFSSMKTGDVFGGK